jgi:hypothetical protein
MCPQRCPCLPCTPWTPLLIHVTNRLFTPSGSLLATGTSPTAPDAKKARTNAALAANIWAAYERATDDDDALKTLTLELSEYNMHIALVAPRVLLCLIGPRTPTRHSSSRSSAHSQEPELRMTPPGSAPRSNHGGGGGVGELFGEGVEGL